MNEIELHEEQAQPIAPVAPIEPMTPTERITANEKMLAAIGPVIKKDHVIKAQGTSYVKVAGGIAIANALGFTISTSKPEFIDNAEGQYYESNAYLLDNGRVIAEAVGYLGMDESRWADEPIYSKRSMAQTRAVARLCRQNFAHFYISIGASDTAWEEVPTTAPKKVASNAKPAPKSKEPVTVPTHDDGSEPADGIYNITACELKREGEGANGPWKIHSVSTAEGYEFDCFNADPDKLAQAIEDGSTIHVKQITQTQYGYTAKYIDAVGKESAKKVVNTATPPKEEVPF